MSADTGGPANIIPRSTIEEIVGYRDKTIELYGAAWEAMAAADRAVKAACAMRQRVSPGTNGFNEFAYGEIAAFSKALQLPDREGYLRTAQRLTDITAWSWLVERTNLERLMDKEAKDKLRAQLRYIPPTRTRYNEGDLITAEEAEQGMPAITVANIYATLESLALDAPSIFRRGIANAFSKLDRRFRSHDGFKVGARVILEYAFGEWGSWNYHRHHRDTLMDIERTFCVLDGKPVGETYASAIGAVDEERRRGHGRRQSEIDTEYFKIRIWKNGNAHLWFTRDDLVEKVNKLLAEWYGATVGDGQTQEEDPLADIKTTPAKRYGFFPTPDAAAERLLDRVPLYQERKDGPLLVLEPSAGTGNLARRCVRPAEKDRAPVHVDCVEIQPAFADILRADGIYRSVACCDFLSLQPNPARLYDVVVMNPPFDRERDIDHVVHALKFLKPDGFMAAIMSAGTEFRETKKAQAFREIVAKAGGRFTDLPAGSFSESGTNVNTVMVRFYKDGRSFW